jgi:tryptophan-rich sensory protein
MSQSLQSQLHQLLPEGSNNTDSKTVKTGLLKIVDNTLVFGNTVYQVRNISSLTLADLSETYSVNMKVPAWYWFLVALGIVLLFFFIGIFVLGYAGWLFWQHSQLEKSRSVEKFGLKLVMNSGESMILTSKSKDFVLSIILNIYHVLNSEEPKALTFNFETLQIEDKSINIERSYGSSVVSGQVSGDVVNNLSI